MFVLSITGFYLGFPLFPLPYSNVKYNVLKLNMMKQSKTI